MSATCADNAVCDLPELVARYVARNLPAHLRHERVRFRQTGEMQLKPGRWSSFRAEQEMAATRVEFVWRADFRLAPLVPLRVNDWYRDGSGGLDGKLWRRLPIMRVRGEEVARGEAMRYLAELPWMPQAMIDNTELEWRAVDNKTVEVATHVGAAQAAVTLHFDDAGDIVAASASARPRLVGKETVETPFRGEFADYREFGGARMPTRAEVSWLLADGPFIYFRAEVTDVEHD